MNENIKVCPFCKKSEDYVVAPEGYKTCNHCKYIIYTKPQHKYIESTEYAGQQIEQKDLTEL